MVAEKKGYHSRYWLTYNQAAELGGYVKKGEKITFVVYFNFKKVTTDRGGNPYVNKKGEVEPREIPYLKYFNVFNLEQIDGIPDEKLPVDAFPQLPELKQHETLSLCEQIVTGYNDCPPIKHVKDYPCYSITHDYINVPEMGRFFTAENYYTTLYHEMVHSTCAEKRLDRFKKGINLNNGRKEYSKEELVAEVGAAYLCYNSGILPEEIAECASYIQGWMNAINADKTLLVSAFSKAGKAVDYITG